MRAFISWSGGKDCMFALHRFLKITGHEMVCLVNMCNREGTHSSSHSIKRELIKMQADCIEIPVIQHATDFSGYEKNFKHVIHGLRKKNVDTGVFGDIYLKEHRDWIERVCSEMSIKPLFPLWGGNTGDLLRGFVADGFKTIIISINNTKLSNDWLGRVINDEFVDEITLLEGIDPCAENGEYHSFVYDGPLFKAPVPFTMGKTYADKNTTYLELNTN